MDFALSEELQMLQDTVRKFVDQEMIPVEMECRDGVALKPEYRERFEAKAREMGLWMLDVPEEFGGAGLNLMAQVIIWAEVARSVAIPSRGRSIFGPEVRPVLYAMNERAPSPTDQGRLPYQAPIRTDRSIYLGPDMQRLSQRRPCSG